MPRKRSYSGPLLPGTKSVRTVNRRPRVVRRTRFRPGLRKAIQNITLAKCETKTSNQYTTDQASLFHNKAYYAANLLATTQGTQDPSGLSQAKSNRIGDEVLAKGLQLKFNLETQLTKQNQSYRIVVFRYNTLEPPLDDSYFWCGTDGAGGNMNRLLDKPQTERVKVIKQMFINPTYQANYGISSAVSDGQRKSFTKSCYIPLNNRKIKYNGDGSPNPRFTNIGFMVLSYDSFTTLETDINSFLQWTSTFYYKDP